MAIKRIGTVVNTIGIKGDLKVVSHTDSIDKRFKKGNTILIDNSEFIIENYNNKGNIIVVHLKGMNDINKVSILKGKEIYQDVILEKGYFFLDDVNGFDVVSVNDNKIFGKISDYREINDMIYFVVGKYLLPYLKEIYVDKIDFQERRIYITDLAKGIFE